MGRFIIRRLVGMVVVMFAVSVLTFLIFNVIPNGDPADRMAGKNSTPVQIEAIEKEWGFDKPLYTQYATTMEKVVTGDLISYANQTNVVEEIKRGIPRTFALAIGAALMWFAMGTALGLYTAMRAGRWTDTLVTVLALVGVSMPVFWLGALASYYLGFKAGHLPQRRLLGDRRGRPVAVGQPHDPAVARARDAVHRRLLARAALQRPGHDQRRLRAHRARQGAHRAAGDDPPRPAQLADPDRHAVGPGLRRGARRRRDPHRDGLRPAGRRAVLRRVDRPARRAAGARGRRCSARSSSCCSTRSSTSSTPRSTRGSGCHDARRTSERLLDVQNLNVSFATEEGIVQAVDEVSFTLCAGEVLAVVGESGSGKSVTAMTLMGLTRSPNARFARLGEAARPGPRHRRPTTSCAPSAAEEIAMIFQDPMTSLNPVHRIGKQIVEQIQAHRDVSDAEARDLVVDAARARRHPAGAGALRLLPARVLRRHAPARDDRDGAVAATRRCSSPTSRRRRST